MINNRQNGRRRGRGSGAPRPNGGNGAPDRGNRLDNRARGNAAQLHEKYKTLARDAQMQGDRVTAEYYLQFADHYFRILAESRARFEEQRPARGDNDAFDEENDGDDNGDDRFDEPQFDRRPQQQYRDDRPDNRNDRRPQEERGERRPQEERGERRPRYRDERGEARPPENRERQPRYTEEQVPRVEAREVSQELPLDAPAAERPRRGRPRNDQAVATAPAAVEAEFALTTPEAERRPRGRRPAAVNGAEQGEARIEVDRLPPAFTAEPRLAEIADAEEAPKRRRIRKPKADEATVEL